MPVATAGTIPDSILEYSSNEFDGEWKGPARSNGNCKTGRFKLSITGQMITGTYTYKSKRYGVQESMVVGVIHENHTVELALTKITERGKEGAPRGEISRNLLAGTMPGRKCTRKFSLERQ